MGLNSPFLGRGCGSAWKEKQKDTHTLELRKGLAAARRSRAAAPDR